MKTKPERSTLLKIITITTSLFQPSQSTGVNTRGSNTISPSVKDDAGFTQITPYKAPLQLKKSVSVGVSNTNTLLDAIKSGDAKTVELLLKNGADPNKADKEGRTVLMVAANYGYEKITQLSLNKDADPNKADNNGFTALYFAAQNGHLNVVKYLVKKGANVNKANNKGFTPLYIAAQYGLLNVIECLVKKGADVNKADNNGVTPLHIAAYTGRLDVVKYLVEKEGIEVNQATNNGFTPLYIAAQNGRLDIIECLVKKGADVNQADNIGDTPLMLAADKGYKKIVELLLEKGANLDQSNVDKSLAIAKKNDNEVIATLLQNYIEKSNNQEEGKNSGSYIFPGIALIMILRSHIFSTIALAIILPLLHPASRIISEAYRKISTRHNIREIANISKEEAENNLKKSKEKVMTDIIRLLNKISTSFMFELNEKDNILSLKLTPDDEKQKYLITKIINSNNKNRFFIVSKTIKISLNEPDNCPYERDIDIYRIKKDFTAALDSIKKSIEARELADKKGKELKEQISEAKHLLQNTLDNIAKKEHRLQTFIEHKNPEGASKIKESLCALVEGAIKYHETLKTLDTNDNDKNNNAQIADLEKKLNDYKVSQVAAVGQDNSGEVAGQAVPAASTSQEVEDQSESAASTSQGVEDQSESAASTSQGVEDQSESAASTSQEVVDQTKPTEEIQSIHTPTLPISFPSARTIEQKLTLSDLNKFRDLLYGISQGTFIMIESAQEKPNSANPLTSEEAKEIAKTTSSVFEESKQKAAATQDNEKLNQEKENFHALLEQAIQNVQYNSQQLPQQAEYKTIKSLIYAFLCHCTGDEESVKEAYIKIENEGKQTGSYTGLGHASGNTIENLKSLQDLLQHFIASKSDIETRIFQAANYNDLIEFLQSHHLLKKDINPEQPQIKRIIYDIPKNPQEYVIDLAKEIIINPEIKAQDAGFASKIKKEIEEFITGNKLLLNHVESNKENGQSLIMIADNDVESFLREDIKKDFKDLKRIIEISLNNEEQEEDIAESFNRTTFSYFMNKLIDIFTQEEHKIKTEHRDREVGQAR